MLHSLILNAGAHKTGSISTKDIPFAPSLLELCKMNRCGKYGKSYTCPPLIGDVETLIANAKSYHQAIVFQKIYLLEDSFDLESMLQGKKDFKALTKRIYQICVENLDDFCLLGAGACDICETCGALDGTPCRFPDQAIASLESYGIQVSSLAERCGLKYINGQNTVTYFGVILYN